ncbi:MAG TPA: GDSL-type esterase/lipase family protein [Thermoanaerobaculia bacterium]|jgi:lysophospholipase L1-like esterase
MRRLLWWYLPAGTALAAAVVFAYGFASYLRGDLGTPVNLSAAPATTTRAAGPRAMLAPILLGDSLARGAGDATGLGIGGRLDDELRRRGVRAHRTVNLGLNGARTPDLLRELERPNVRRLLAESNVVILSIGGNDLWGGSDWRNAPPPDPEKVMSEVLGRVEAAVRSVRAAAPRARIFFIGLYNPFLATPFGATLTPLVHRWNTRLVERFAGDPNFVVVQTSDLFAYHDRLAVDRFHPSGEGYALIARRIADAL